MLKNGSKTFSKNNHWAKLLKEIKEKKNKITEQKMIFEISQKTIAYPIKPATVSLPKRYAKLRAKKRSRHQLYEPYQNVYLTQRELDCIVAIIKYKTMMASANSLNLSPRTVEFYFENVKKKLQCRKKKEVIERIQQMDLIRKLLGKDALKN